MGSIIEALSRAEKKGPFLELLVEDIFNDDKFTNVIRQNGGSQFGYDLIAYKNKECWKIECKNLKSRSRISDITPKLIWHIGNSPIDRFVIVSPSGISNELRYFLEQKLFYFPVEVWHSDFLEKKISQSSKAMERLGMATFMANNDAQPEIFPPNEISFDVYHAFDKPYSFDYFLRDKAIVKAFSEQKFIVRAIINNPTNSDLTINEVNVRTVSFEPLNSRLLRQYKMKGIVEPIKLEFSPKDYPEGQSSLLSQSEIIEIKSGTHDHLSFILARKTRPGFYQFIFELIGRFRQQTIKMYSPVFAMNKVHDNADIVRLCVVGKYYDSPVEKILSLTNEQWELLKAHKESMIFLGQTMFGAIAGEQQKTWKIIEMGAEQETELLDLGIPLEEKLYSSEDALGNILGKEIS